MDGGRLIVLPVALPKNPFLDWLYKVTGESPSESMKSFEFKLKQPFVQAGFKTEIHTRNLQSSRLLIVIAKKE